MLSGQTEAWTSPMCAFSSNAMQMRDCPIPPPMVSGQAALQQHAVERQLCAFFAACRSKLFAQRLRIDADSHGGEFQRTGSGWDTR